MERIDVAAGVTVIDSGAGIGNERYVPSDPRQQRYVRHTDGQEGPFIVGEGVEQHHREWVQSEGWREVGQAAIAAASQEQTT